MEKLVLSVIAVIVVHITFVLYMADVMSIGQNNATLRSEPARTTPERVVVNSLVNKELQASVTPPSSEDPPSRLIARHTEPMRSRASRLTSAGSSETKEHSRPRALETYRRIPAFQASQRPQPVERRPFSDRIIYYRKANPDRQARTLAAVFPPIDDDNNAPKPKKSLVAKLQYVYKKPWDLIKAVGSKLR